MGQYVIKRFLTIVPVLVGISIIVFGFIHLIPGDPAVTMLGERATPERVKEVRTQLGLDEPLYTQYFIYLGKILRGDLGPRSCAETPSCWTWCEGFRQRSSWPSARS